MLVSERSQRKNYRFVSLACRLSSQQLASVLISAFELVPYKTRKGEPATSTRNRKMKIGNKI